MITLKCFITLFSAALCHDHMIWIMIDERARQCFTPEKIRGMELAISNS